MRLMSFAFLLSFCLAVSTHAQNKAPEGQNKELQTEQKNVSMVEETPSFPGGEMALVQYIQSHTLYPKKAIKKGVEGCCLVGFVVDAKGKITQVAILNPINPALDAEAIRVVKAMPTWKPGKLNGKAVAVAYTLPVVFKLQEAPSMK